MLRRARARSNRMKLIMRATESALCAPAVAKPEDLMTANLLPLFV